MASASVGFKVGCRALDSFWFKLRKCMLRGWGSDGGSTKSRPLRDGRLGFGGKLGLRSPVPLRAFLVGGTKLHAQRIHTQRQGVLQSGSCARPFSTSASFLVWRSARRASTHSKADRRCLLELKVFDCVGGLHTFARLEPEGVGP